MYNTLTFLQRLLFALLMGLLAFIPSWLRFTSASELSTATSRHARSRTYHTPDPCEDVPADFPAAPKPKVTQDDKPIIPGVHEAMDMGTATSKTGPSEMALDGGDSSSVAVTKNPLGQNENIEPPARETEQDILNIQEPDISYRPFEADNPLPRIRPPESNPETGPTFDALVSSVVSSTQPHDFKKLLSDIRELTSLTRDRKRRFAIASNTELSRQLWHFVQNKASDTETEIRSASALLLATAVRKDLQTLFALLGNFDIIFRREIKLGVFIHEQLKDVRATLEAETSTDTDITFASSLISLFQQVCLEYSQLFDFKGDKGLETLAYFFGVSVMVERAENEAYGKLRTRIAEFVIGFAFTLVKQLGEAKDMLSICRSSVEFLDRFGRDVPGYEKVCEARKVLEDVLGDRCDSYESDCRSKGID